MGHSQYLIGRDRAIGDVLPDLFGSDKTVVHNKVLVGVKKIKK
jgi:hypothetical protein